MTSFLRACALFGGALLLAGCGTITRGTTEDVTIKVAPDDAVVTTSLGHRCSSPCTLKIGRKDTFTVTATRDGYQTATVDVKTKVSGGGAAGFAGNVLAGGIVGMGVDASTGAALDHDPNPVVIQMLPLGATPAKRVQPVPAAKPRPRTGKVAPTS